MGWGGVKVPRRQILSKMSWRPKAVSMVVFLKWINGVYYTYKDVINLKIVCGRVDHAVDNQLLCFCGCSYVKKEKMGRRRRGEKVSHMLCRFANHSFDCYRLIGKMW